MRCLPASLVRAVKQNIVAARLRRGERNRGTRGRRSLTERRRAAFKPEQEAAAERRTIRAVRARTVSEKLPGRDNTLLITARRQVADAPGLRVKRSVTESVLSDHMQRQRETGSRAGRRGETDRIITRGNRVGGSSAAGQAPDQDVALKQGQLIRVGKRGSINAPGCRGRIQRGRRIRHITIAAPGIGRGETDGQRHVYCLCRGWSS